MNEEITPGYLQTITIIHFSLMAGILMFASIVYFMLINPAAGNTDQEFYDIAIILAPALAVIGFFLGNNVGKKIIRKNQDKDWKLRLAAYQKALLVRDATLEGPALFAIVCALFTNKVEFFLIVIAILLIMFMIRPTKIISEKHWLISGCQ